MVRIFLCALIFSAIAAIPAVAAADPLFGRENLAAFYAALVNSRAIGSPVLIHLEGDSKVSGVGVTDGYRLDQLITDASNGYPVTATYDGFGGEGSYLWANGKAAEFVAQHPSVSLLIIDFGTNDFRPYAIGGAQSLAQIKANHLAAIATIRAVRSSSQLSILILGQTPADNWNPYYNQTTENMTADNAVLKEVAEETNSAFFDTLQLFTRAHSEAGWMEQLPVPDYGGGNVHPGNPMNLVLVGELGKALFPIPFRVPKRGDDRPNLLSHWVPVNPAVPPRAALRGDLVVLDGMIAGGRDSLDDKLMALSLGYRPPSDRYVLVPTSTRGTFVQLKIGADGFVRIASKFRGNYISLDGISFRVE